MLDLFYPYLIIVGVVLLLIGLLSNCIDKMFKDVWNEIKHIEIEMKRNKKGE